MSADPVSHALASSSFELKGSFGMWSERFFSLVTSPDGAGLQLLTFASEDAAESGAHPQSSRRLANLRDVGDREGMRSHRFDLVVGFRVGDSVVEGDRTVALAAPSADTKATWVSLIAETLGIEVDAAYAAASDGAADAEAAAAEAAAADAAAAAAEALAAFTARFGEEMLQATRDAFIAGDDDDDAILNRDELAAALWPLPRMGKLADEQVSALVAAVDMDDDGAIDFDEFLALVTRATESAAASVIARALRRAKARAGMLALVSRTEEWMRTAVEQRTKREEIRLNDCKNVIELMDEVKQGKLRATLAALEAGYFLGAGRQGQVGFAAFSLLCFACAAVAIVIMPTQKFFGSGVFLIVPIGMSFAARAWHLRQLEQHLATSGQGGAACGSTGKAGLLAAKTTDRLNQGAQRALCAGISVLTVMLAWVVVFYGISGGNIGLEPVLPRDPSTAFFACCLAGVPTCACALVHLAWLVGGGRMKEAQVWLGRVLISLGIMCAVLSALTTDTTGRAVIASTGAAFLIINGLLAANLRHRQNAAMTAELKQDIAAYEQVWDKVTKDPVQMGYVRSLETKLEQTQADAKAKSAARPTFELEQRSTAEQLVVMLAQAWGLNDKFQNLACAWKAKLREEGHLAAAEEPDEQEQGLLPKRRKRAIEKVWRGYKGDATRLRDLVRCSLVFNSVEQLEAAIDKIITDRAIEILRVKNRFASTYDVKESCGYRDIQLNAVVTAQNFDAAEIELGLHEHICEIQLHLKPMYDLKNDEGHKRYVKFRNERAE